MHLIQNDVVFHQVDHFELVGDIKGLALADCTSLGDRQPDQTAAGAYFQSAEIPSKDISKLRDRYRSPSCFTPLPFKLDMMGDSHPCILEIIFVVTQHMAGKGHTGDPGLATAA